MADEFVSQAEFARQVGVTAQRINKLVKDGRIPVNADKKIPIKAGFKAFDKIQKNAKAFKEIYSKTILPEDDNAPMSGSTSKAMNVTEAFNKARLAEKTYQAKLKEIEYKLKTGELVESQKVRADAQATASALRDRLMSTPVRIAGLCEGRTAREIEEIIEDALNEALSLFQKSEFIE